jgi:hypothetical protein
VVSSNPPGLLCTTGSCSHDFPYGSTVSLSAVPDTGSAFAFWSGDYSGVATSITVRAGSYQVIRAAFQPPIDHFELTALPDHLPANGMDTATLTVRATTDAGSGTPFAGRAVDLALDPALGELSARAITLDADGAATTTFTAGTTPGTETITAAVFENGLPRVVTASLTLDPNPLTGQISVIHTDDTLTYTFTLTNDAVFVQTVSLSASLPPNTAFDSVGGGLFSATGGDFGNGYVYADSVELAPGQSYTLNWVIHHLVSVGDFLTVAHAASTQASLRLTNLFRAEGLFLPLIMNNQPGSP